MEKEKKIKIINKKKRTGKYYEKEVEVASSRPINLNKNYTDNWDEGLYSAPGTGPTISLRDIRCNPIINSQPEAPEPEIRTLQEYLDNKYPIDEEKKAVEEIDMNRINNERRILDINKKRQIRENLEGGELDLSKYTNVKRIEISDCHFKTPITNLILGKKPELFFLNCPCNQLTSLDVSECFNLEVLQCWGNQLTSIDFLNQLPHPEKVISLKVNGNNIKPTDINIFSPFKNTVFLTLGSILGDLKKGKRNKFYGSLKSWKSLNKLSAIDIEATDIDKGLEYLPFKLSEAQVKQAIKEGKKGITYENCLRIQCLPYDTNAKCSAIEEQLRNYNYDLGAWQLAKQTYQNEIMPGAWPYESK